MIFVFCERTGIAIPHARGSNPKNIYIENILYITTVVGEYRSIIYQSDRLPSKKYRALPWGLSTRCTRSVADYRPINTVHYRGG